MNILFLSISSSVSNIENHGIYPDLLRKFAKEGHNIWIVCPAERRLKIKTNFKLSHNVGTLIVKTLNITKTNFIEKGLATLLIEYLYSKAIRKYLKKTKFNLILYSTPPITFTRLIKKLTKLHHAATYLLLKDIFPQNAVDLGLIKKWNPVYPFFRAKEKSLYKISDHIGCMSPANISFLAKNNTSISQEKLEICPNSIEIFSGKYCDDKTELRKRYGIPNDLPVCIYGGNLGKPQGIDFLLEVLIANMNRVDVFFIIAGSGTEEYKISHFITAQKPENIMVMPQMPRSDFDKLLYMCDIGLIFLDKRFTIPNYPSRLLNYLEFKKPVMMAVDRCTDVGFIAEKNNYGFWVESGDLTAFNQKLNQLLSNSELLKQMGDNGYKYLKEHYTVEKSYETIISHFS